MHPKTGSDRKFTHDHYSLLLRPNLLVRFVECVMRLPKKKKNNNFSQEILTRPPKFNCPQNSSVLENRSILNTKS